MPEITIKVRLSDEDRKLLAAVEAAARAITGKGGKKAQADDDGVDDVDGMSGDGSVDDDDGGEGDGDEGGDGDGDDFADDAGEEEKKPTKADVQTALRDLSVVTSKANAIKLMKEKGGVDALTKLKESKFTAVIDAAKLATKKAKAAKNK